MPAAPSDCLHFGAATGETVACPSCRGSVKLKTFACAVHGACTPQKKAPGVACCAGCPDRAPRLPPGALPDSHRFGVRDCLYHVYPAGGAAAPIWRRCLATLLRRASLFTGRRVISCMTGAGLEPPSAVRAMASPHDFEVIEVRNDPKLREVRTLLEVLPRFETTDPHRALFLGHAKGVTRPDNDGVTCHPWSAICHEACLDYWPLAEAQLRAYPVTGPFRKLGHGFRGSRSSWHYSGSFWWVRSAALFSRDWHTVDRQWWGAEAYPSLHFARDEAGCLFHGGQGPALDLYSMPYFQRVAAEWLAWKLRHEQDRTQEVIGP